MKKYILFLILLPLLAIGQTTQTFSTAGSGSFIVPNGVTSVDVQAWGGGGCGANNIDSPTSGASGGGGGGAYTGGTISVSSGASLAYTVGAGGVYSLANSNPTNRGGVSNFSVLIANGGARGLRQIISLGGPGGAASVDPGGVTSFISYSGGTGGAGGSAATTVNFGGGGGGGAAGTTGSGAVGANGVLNTGGAGGAGGATGGGAGGKGSDYNVSNGTAGSVPGGGGGGRAYGNTGNNSDGGRGEIRVTYTCPSYDVLTVAASASQFSSGAPSTITLTSSSLTAGIYTVTYSTTNPVTSGNIASMSFSGTTGTFLTMNLTADSDITVTSLQSGSGVGCSSTITTNNTATAVLASVLVTAGAIGTNHTICSGSTPSSLTSTIVGTTSSGTLSYEWQTNASGSYVTIPSETAAAYSPPALTATTSYQRRTVAVNGGSTIYSGYTTPVTITINTATAGTISIATSTICNGATAAITSATAGTASGTLSYEWQTNATGFYVTISGATAATYTTPVLTATTSYQRRTVSVLNGTTCYSAYTSPLTITVSTVVLNPGTIGTAQTICTGNAPSTLTSVADGSASDGGAFTYQWQTNASGAYLDISGATGATYSPPSLTATTNYRRRTIYTATNCLVTSNVIGITVNPNISAVVVTPNAAQNVCQAVGGSTLTVAVTGGGSFTRLWGKRAVSGGPITNLGATGATLTPTASNVGVGSWFIVCTATPTCGSPTVSNEVSITINPTPTLVGVTQAATICEGSVATINLTGLVASSTATVTYTINGGATVTLTDLVADAAGAASFNTAALTPANNGQVLQITGVTITSATPNCTFVPASKTVTLAVNANLSAVTVTEPVTSLTSQTICSGTADWKALSVAVTAGIGTPVRQWGKRSVTGGAITDIVGQTGTSFNPSTFYLGVGNWLVVCTVTHACGSAIISNEYPVTINPTATLTGASQAATVCEGSVATINLAGLLASSTSTVSYTINGAAHTPISVVADAAGAASFSTTALTSANNGQTLQITGITITSATPNCTATFTQNVTLSVTANLSAVAITPISDQTFCQVSSGTQLSVGVTGGGTFTRLWGKRSVTNGTITSLGATGANFTPTVGNLGVGSWLVVCTVTPTCGSATVSNEVAVTINPTPTLTGASQAEAVCDGSGATINLTGLVASSMATVTYTINGGSTITLTGLVADASGAGSFTTAALTAANNGEVLQITGVTITSATPNCPATFTQNVTLSVTSNLSAVATTPNTAQTFCQGSSGSILTVTPTGGGTVTRQWGKRSVTNGTITDVAGANGSTFTPSASNLGAGTWLVVCTITPTCGSPTISNEVAVTINPTPSVTGATQAAAVCDGAGATINLTGLVASSTATITYTINGGGAITLPALVADASGAASFTTAALTPANNGQVLQITSVTITSATPNCTFNPSSRTVTLVVNANLSTVAITPITAQAICYTASGSVLTVVETGGGTITRQWGKRSSTGGAITDIVGQTATTYTPTGASLGAGSWFVVCTSTPACGGPIISNEVSVTVSAPLTLTDASQAASICSGSAAVINLTGLLPSSTATITYQIAGGTTRTVPGVVADASGNASFTTITTLTGTNNGQILQITGITIPSASPVCTTVFAQNLTLSVIAPTIGSYSQSTAVCAGSSATILLTGMLPNTTSTISYTLAGTTQPDITGVVSDASGNASFSIVATNSQNFRIFSITTTSTTPNCTTAIGSSGAFNLSVPTITAGSIGTAQTVCSGTAPATLTSVVDGTIGAGTISYEWQADDGTGYVTISGAVASTYSPPALTTTTSYKRRTLSLLSGQTCYSAYTTAITMTVNTLTAGSIGGATTICSENSRNIFQLTAGTTSIGSAVKSYEWQANDGTGWITIPGEIDTSYQTPVLTITTSYRRRTVAVSNGVTCYSDYTTPVTITINSVNAGLIGTKQSICAGDTPAPLTSITPGTGAGTITYQWQSRILPAVFADIPGETGPTYSPGVTTQQTTFRRRVLSTLNGVTCVSSYVAVTIRVNDPDEGIIGTNQTICAGSTPATLTSIEAGVAPGVITYEWQADNGSGYATIAGATSATYTPSALNVTNSYQRRTLGVCAGLPTASPWTTAVTITVNAVTAGTIGSNQTFCTAATPATLTSTTAGTGSGTISYEWQTNASGSYVTISGATAATYSPPAVAATTSYQRRTISILNGVTCTSAYTTPITITIDSNPAAPTISGTTNATCVPFTGSVTLAGLPATGTWTINPGGITGTGTNYTITGLSSGNYTFTVTNSNGCVSNATSTATVASVVINTWNGTTWSNGSPSNQQALVFNSDYPPTVDPNVDLYGCSCTVNTGSNVTIKTGRSLIITDQLSVLDTGTLTFENTASLAQINDVVNTGNIFYQRTTPNLLETDYTYWSSPVLGQTLTAISPINYPDPGSYFYSFNNSTDQWSAALSGNTVMSPGVGYIMRGQDIPGPNITATFVGIPNNGVQIVNSVSSTNSFLIGNPYPSAIDADLFLAANAANIEGTIYFWTHRTPITNLVYSADDYASYNITGGVGTGSNSGSLAPTGKIAAAQGFFATSKAIGPVTFNNSMRLTNLGVPFNNSNFYKTKNNVKYNAIEKHRVWLDFTNSQGAFKQILLGYVQNATNEYDSAYDGKSFDGNEFVDFYSINQDKKLVIQGRSLPFDDRDEIPLGYRVAVDGTFSIGINQKDGLLSKQSIFIEDKLTNTVYNLNEGKYTFSTVKGTFDNRFVLKYYYKTLGVKETELSKGISVLFSNNNRTLFIRNNLKDGTVTTATLFNIAGQKIANWDVKGREQTNIQIAIKNMPSAIYIVKLNTSKGELSEKIIIK